MQTRTCFNGGELSAQMAARCDVDAYMRGCRVLENWELSQMGGVKRRRGMREVCKAQGRKSKVVAYEYSVDGGVYLVELSGRVVRVIGTGGTVVAQFYSGVRDVPAFELGSDVRVRQMNALLIITCRGNAPLVLRYNESGWTLKEVEFTQYPWRYDHERRDNAIELSVVEGTGGRVYSVRFDEAEDENETVLHTGDVLRVSVPMDEAEGAEPGEDVRERARIVTGVEPCAVGDVVAVKTEETLCYWVCVKEFPADVYVSGLDDPACYPDNFVESETVSGFDGVTKVTSVQQLGTVAKGRKFAVRSAYWEYYTCIKEFTSGDIVSTLTRYDDYDSFFIRGVAQGEALPCMGKWSFYCSGMWYGSYEVRRSFEGRELSDEWEVAGVSFSRVSEATNTTLAGDESDEECWLRLFLTRSKWMSDSDLADGYPSDSCGNRLVVDGYRHDMVLRYGEGLWQLAGKVDVGWVGKARVYDWSWAAFSQRYGYPVQCEVFNQRLVFAGTVGQPQTVWMSRVDDLWNFKTGDTDDAAIYLTLYTTSQNAICWMLQANNRLMLGTSDGEWTISAPQGQAITAANAWVSQHGRVGAKAGLMLGVDDKALFVERGGGRLWSYGYSFEVDGCRSTDLTVFAPHVLSAHGGAVDCAVMKVPDTVAVFVCGDGQLALCTYNATHQVQAWHRWVTDGKVLSCAVLPRANAVDALYLVVERADGVWIEVVDELSRYEDRGGRTYVSTLVTTALGNVLEQVVEKRPKERVVALLGEDMKTADVEVCADGGSWVKPATNKPVLEAGWRELLVVNAWRYDHAVGVRVTGGSASILALQG